MPGGETLFSLIDIRSGYAREENILQLNMFNNQLMQAIQASTSGLIISNPKDEVNPILFANNAFCDLTGLELKSLVGAQCCNSVLELVESDQHKELFSDAVASFQEFDLEWESEVNGERRFLHIQLNPVFDDSHNLDLYIGILNDITVLKQREAELSQSQKLESLGQLAAGVAHDFNNILSIISGYTLMAKTHLSEEDEKLNGYLIKVEAASERGAALTHKMLTFSRHKIFSESVVNVCDVLTEQAVLLKPLLGAMVKLNIDLPEGGSANIRGNMDSFEQIIMNLAVNARDAMPYGGDLDISVSLCGADEIPFGSYGDVECVRYVRVCVADHGMGMEAETLARVFDPFFSTKEQGKGTGLGMSIVYGLIQEMGGLVDVRSELERGTTVSMYIPQTEDSADVRSVTMDGTDISALCLDGYTVLVAEDEPDLLKLVKSMLEDLGLNVLTAVNGNDALFVQEEYDGKIDVLYERLSGKWFYGACYLA